MKAIKYDGKYYLVAKCNKTEQGIEGIFQDGTAVELPRGYTLQDSILVPEPVNRNLKQALVDILYYVGVHGDFSIWERDSTIIFRILDDDNVDVTWVYQKSKGIWEIDLPNVKKKDLVTMSKRVFSILESQFGNYPVESIHCKDLLTPFKSPRSFLCKNTKTGEWEYYHYSECEGVYTSKENIL